MCRKSKTHKGAKLRCDGLIPVLSRVEGYLISFMSVALFTLTCTANAELIGWWKLDEGSGIEFWDETDYWHDGTIDPWNEAKVRWTTEGYDSNALEFVSATEPFTMCDASITTNLLNISEATTSFWMNMPTTFQAWGPIFVFLGTSGDHSVECNGVGDLYIADFGVDTYGDLGTSGAKLNDNQWHHVAITYSVTANTMVVYVDGQAAGSQSFTANDPITAVRIGGPRSDGRAQWRRYIGRLDEAAVWNHGLSADEVQNVFWFGPRWTRFATNPQPANGATIGTTNVTLGWTAGDTATQHHVYIGESLEDVQNGTGGTDHGLTGETTFSNYSWELGKTYYLRIDEVEADGVTVHTGAVWSFTISTKLASNPVPSNDARLVATNVTLSWTAGSGAISHNVYFGTDPDNIPLASETQTETTYQQESLDLNTTYYWRIDEFDGTDIYTGDLWSFKTTPDIKITDPNLVGWFNFNADENNIAVDWSGYGNHGNIFGNPNRVDGYDLGALEFDGIDDHIEIPRLISTDLTIMAWIETSTPGATGTTAREGSGLFWSDHAGGGDHFLLAVLGTKLAFETGPGGNPNTTSNRDVVKGEWVHVAVTREESSKDVEFFIDAAPDVTGNHSGDNNVGSNPMIVIGANLLDSRYFTGFIDEVRFYDRVLTQQEIEQAMITNPAIARGAIPANGGTPDIEHITSLSWVPGENAVQHDVYFDTDADAVEEADTSDTTGIYRRRQDPNTYTLSITFEVGQTYYWRIDEIDSNANISKGRVWSFTVANYLVVDDFEDYDDVDNRIYYAWEDYYVNNTGMTVGHLEAPFAERLIVHSGSQSMYMRYDNDGTVNEGTSLEKAGTLFYSEAQRSWQAPQDWTRRGVNSLTMWLRGISASVGSFTLGPPITMTGSGADIWENSDQFHYAYKRLSGIGSITAKVVSMTNTHNSAKAGVMIRESLEPDAAHAMVAIQPMNEVQLLYRSTAGDDSIAIGQSEISTPVWVRLTRSGNTLTGMYSVDGATWETLDTAIVPMLPDVYIGLIVCSHDNNATCTAEFSDVDIDGTVTSDWQSQDIGIESNTAEPMYMVLKDNAGSSALVNHPDPAATTVSTWTEWNIPLADFTGVNPQAIKKMAIGVGDRTNPPPQLSAKAEAGGGAGDLYIDDIRLNIPMSAE